MARIGALRRALPSITRHFGESAQRVYGLRELAAELQLHRNEWQLPQSLSRDVFADGLVQRGLLRRITLASASYADVTRFAMPGASPLEIALSLKPGAYFSHGTAVYLHGLTEEIPRNFYVNAEQSPKPQRGSLTQAGLDLAFRRPARISNYLFTFDDYRVTLISGKHTGRLEVGQLVGPAGERLDSTKLERTLIDITVRPTYAGGVHKVLEAFETARDRVSVNTLVATLRKLDYLYPYHQAIGFYLERAGYEPQRVELLRQLPVELNFYLAHDLRETDYDPAWRLFIPKGF